jgi:hypothetical protein
MDSPQTFSLEIIPDAAHPYIVSDVFDFSQIIANSRNRHQALLMYVECAQH